MIPIETEENTETVKQYAGLYSYNGKNYLTGYTLCRQEDGWQIQSLSAPALSLESGEVMRLSKEESRKTSEQSVLKAEKMKDRQSKEKTWIKKKVVDFLGIRLNNPDGGGDFGSCSISVLHREKNLPDRRSECGSGAAGDRKSRF